jgi:hypothetical protein
VYDPTGDRVLLMPSGLNCASDEERCGALWQLKDDQWTKLSHQATAPDAAFTTLAYDPNRNVSVRFGGCDSPNSNCTANGDIDYDATWEFNGHVWTERCDGPTSLDDDYCATVPPPRHRGVSTFSAETNAVLVFGGAQSNPFVRLSDLWSWDGTAWTELCGVGCTPQPEPRLDTAMAYDWGRQRAVVFGGSSGGAGCNGGPIGNVCDDTWEWGSWGAGVCGGGAFCWQERTSGNGTTPAPRTRHMMAYDRARDVVVLFGGEQQSPVGDDCGDGRSATSGRCLYSDTWEWDGNNWTERVPSESPAGTSPPGRLDGLMVYDEARARIVLFGGQADFAAPLFEDVWEWDGASWRELLVPVPRPTVRTNARATYDSARQRLLVNSLEEQTFTLPLETTQRPGILFEVAWAESGADAAWIDSMTLQADATGTGYTADVEIGGDGDLIGEPVDGVEVWRWVVSEQQWQPMPSTAGASWPVVLESTDAADAQNLVTYVDSQIRLLLAPASGAGNGPAAAEVSMDYAELLVRYRTP